MDRKLLSKLAQTKERLDDIMSLRKEGKKDASKYDEIFEKYGQTMYKIAVPSKYRKAEIKRFMKEGRFEDIYRKHGESVYNNKIYKMQQADVYNETGSKPKSIFNRIKNVIVHRIAPVFLSTLLLTPPALGGAIEYNNSQSRAENSIEYAQEIEEYDRNIKAYAEEINGMDLTHLQTFMKVMSDMWEQIDGYGENTNDISGYLRLSLQEDGQGVCRHFADDVTAKLNAINPEYNARNVNVYMSDNEYHLAKIERTILESNNTVAGEENKQENSGEENITKIFGNHVVTAVDIPGEKVTLILDPTNPGIGVIQAGKIVMFSIPDGKGLEAMPLGNFVMNGAEQTIDLMQTEFQSLLVSDKTVEELRQQYGTEAQNEALEYLKILETEKETINPNHSFEDTIRVDDEQILHRIQEESKAAAERMELQDQNSNENLEENLDNMSR